MSREDIQMFNEWLAYKGFRMNDLRTVNLEGGYKIVIFENYNLPTLEILTYKKEPVIVGVKAQNFINKIKNGV